VGSAGAAVGSAGAAVGTAGGAGGCWHAVSTRLTIMTILINNIRVLRFILSPPYKHWVAHTAVPRLPEKTDRLCGFGFVI
jgi:hypothetical protein